jgi:hypothetical protein
MVEQLGLAITFRADAAILSVDLRDYQGDIGIHTESAGVVNHDSSVLGDGVLKLAGNSGSR